MVRDAMTTGKWVELLKAEEGPGRRLCGILLVGLVILAAGLFVYKCHCTGVTYDEFMSLRDYARSVHEARHNYTSTNNHVLNSILIYASKSWFGGYEQFIRIFPMLSGIVFFVSIAYVITRTVSNRWLWIFGLAMLFCVRQVLNYLVMARGYTYGLSAMGLYPAVVFYFMQRPVPLRHCWAPIVLLSVINFLSLGSMISCVFVMFAMNAVFVLIYSPMLYTGAVSKIKTIVIHGVSIAALSGLLLILLYRPILQGVLHAAENPYVANIAESWKGWSSYKVFIANLLRNEIFREAGTGAGLAMVFYVLFGVFVIIHAVQWFKAVRHGRWGIYFTEQRCGFFILLSFCLYFAAVFVYAVVLKKSPGILRNHVFMIPLFLLTFVWMADGVLRLIRAEAVRGIGVVVLALLMGWIAFDRRPLLREINDQGMAMSRPTLQRLRALDPEKEWAIGFSKEMQYHYMGFHYYKLFDYQFNVVQGQGCNVYICRPEERPARSLVLDYDYFYQYHNCCVVLLGPQDDNKVIYEARPMIRKSD